MRDIRCEKCGKKLGEQKIVEGTISIVCNRRPGNGQGSCNTLNTVTIQRDTPEICDTENKNAI